MTLTAELVGSRAVAHYVLVDAKHHHAENSNTTDCRLANGT